MIQLRIDKGLSKSVPTVMKRREKVRDISRGLKCQRIIIIIIANIY